MEQEDATLLKGQKQIATQGVEGLRRVTVEVTTVDGVETRKVIGEEVVKQPISQVVKVGTKESGYSSGKK